MAVVLETSPFPFTFGPVDPQRVQFWAQYAAQVQTRNGFRTVTLIYDALVWESEVHYSYQQACWAACYFRSDLLRALDQVVCCLGAAVQNWGWFEEWVKLRLEGEERVLSLGPWCQTASEQAAALRASQRAVAEYVSSQCVGSGLAVPQHTAAVLAV